MILQKNMLVLLLLQYSDIGPSVLRAPAEQTKVATVLGN